MTVAKPRKTKNKTKEIPHLPGYAATPNGQIWSTKSNWRGYGSRKMKQDLNGKGYLRVRLTLLEGARRSLPVHKLIAMTFLAPKPGPGFEVRHLNGNPFDNRVSNLRWGTRSENAQDRVKHGRTYRPDWSDPKKRKRWCATMRAGKARAALAAKEKGKVV